MENDIEKLSTYNNKALLRGKVETAFEYSHSVMGEEMHKCTLRVKRRSGVADLVEVMASKEVLAQGYDIGETIEVTGDFRSYNEVVGGGRKTHLYVFAHSIHLPEDISEDLNSINMTGFICRKPVLRVTPKGKKITEFLIAVNRGFGKSDYIPCICWDKTAEYTATLSVSDKITVDGRIQSRPYRKHLSSGEIEERITRELSVGKLIYIKE